MTAFLDLVVEKAAENRLRREEAERHAARTIGKRRPPPKDELGDTIPVDQQPIEPTPKSEDEVLLDFHDYGSEKVSVRTALVAALMDEAGATPIVTASGVSVFVVDTCWTADVTYILEQYHPNVVSPSLAKYVPEELIVLNGTRDINAFDRFYGRGATIAVVLSDKEKNPKAVRAINCSDRVFGFIDVPTGDLVSKVIKAVTGEYVDFNYRDVDGMDFDDILIGVRPNTTARYSLMKCQRARDARQPNDLDKPEPETGPEQKPHEHSPKLSDLSGFGDARAWGLRLAEDLRAFARGELEWRDIDHGVLLTGEPGVGKTFFVRALAAEVGCEFISVSYQDWAAEASFRGDSTAGALNKMMKDWRAKETPFIVFVDEIDSIGKRGGNAQNESWFASQINAWLAFLDGAKPRDGIVVIAATNYPDRVDPAMLRPGRLEREIRIPFPSVQDLRGIIKHHAGIDSLEAARALRGRSPAQVAADCREARRMARSDGRIMDVDDLKAVVASGRVHSPKLDWITAVHEAGHALYSRVAGRTVHAVDIDAGWTDTESTLLLTGTDILTSIRVALAGRAAEEVIFGHTCPGSYDDLEKATVAAIKFHTLYGYGRRGLVSIKPEHARLDPEVMQSVQITLDHMYRDCLDFFYDRKVMLRRLAKALMEARYMDGNEVGEALRSPLFERQSDFGDPAQADVPWSPPRRMAA